MAIAAWLMAMCLPLVKRALFGLGIGVVTYAAYSTIIDQVKSAIETQWGSLGTVTADILALGGVGQAIGIVLGAMVARAAFMAYARFGKLSS